MEVMPGYSCPDGYKQTEVGVIPEDWSVVNYVSFGQVIDGDRGIHYPSAGDLRDAGYCLFLNAGNVTKTGFRFADCQFISADTDKKLNKGKLTRGDVALTTRGTIGNFAYFSKEISFEHIRINSGMVILRNTSEKVDNAYQYLVLRSRIVASQIDRLSFGSAQPQLTVKGISTLKLPLPPTKAEQEAIAVALSDADALMESLEKLIAKKRHLKQGAMQELLPGKKRLLGFSGEWEVKRLGDVAEIDPDNLGSATPADYTFNYISLEDVDLGSLRSYSEQIFCSAPSRARRRLRVGDILVSTVRPNLQSHLLFASAEPNWICSTGFSVVRCKTQDAAPGYIFCHFFGHLVTKQIEALLTGSNYPAINGRDVKALEIPMPTLPEQTAIATILSDMDAEIAALEGKLTKTRQLKQGMMHNLLTGKIRLV